MSLNNKDVQVVSCTLEDLFNSHSKKIKDTEIQGQISIPEYQRPYVWREKQINRLLKDFEEYQKWDLKEKPFFYLGSIILHQDGDKLKVIDGQQRITTMLMLRMLAKDDNFQGNLSYSNPTSINNIKRMFAYLKVIKNNEFYEFQGKNIIENIDFSKINITLVLTTTEDLAYTFFETQNTGGVRLSGSDIVKAHHLRAIPSSKQVNYQARRWEQMDSYKVEHIMQYLSKIRYWDNRNWKAFPLYRNFDKIKTEIIDEFTERTLSSGEDISYYYTAVKKENGRQLQMYESEYKQIRQPLSDGNNSMDYINEYIDLHDLLFNTARRDHRIEDQFYEFVKKLVHNTEYNTIFLKELLEMAIITYVSRFGFHRLTETSLWLYRFIYSLRVLRERVFERGVFRFVQDYQLINNIINVYTIDQLHDFLKRYPYVLNTDELSANRAKGKHIKSITAYFNKEEKVIKFEADFLEYKNKPEQFDKDLIQAINNKINNLKNG